MKSLPRPPEYFIGHLTELGRQVRAAVLSARRASAPFAGISKTTSADTIYQLDTHVEPIIEGYCAHWCKEIPIILIAEGIAQNGIEGRAVYPPGTPESAAAIQLIIDPIDGTRGLMFDKRSAWFLAGIAPNLGSATRLSDIAAAVQVEIPTSKQWASDILSATRGNGAKGLRDDVTGNQRSQPLAFAASKSETLAHGFASIASFFPGTKILAAELFECIAARTLEPGVHIFDDQYISTGGQFYELLIGHDRFIADLRPLFYAIQNQPAGLCVHPYDVAAALIAQEAGIILTNGLGAPLDGPLDTTTALSFAAYANPKLRAAIEPILREFFREKGLPLEP